MPWIKPHAEAELAGWPVRAQSPSTDVCWRRAPIRTDDKKGGAVFPAAVGHGTAIGRLRDYSRNARLIWSVNGFIRNEMTVRSVVRMNASTGMPGLRLSGSSEPSLPSSSLIRTL